MIICFVSHFCFNKGFINLNLPLHATGILRVGAVWIKHSSAKSVDHVSQVNAFGVNSKSHESTDYSICLRRRLWPFLMMIAVACKSTIKQRAEDVAGVGAAGAGDFFGCAGGDDAAAMLASFWSKVNDVVG